MQTWANRVAVATIAVCAAACSSMPQSGENWQPLFDGKTLDGWTPKIRGFPLGENYRDTFRVRDGAIVVSYDKYDQFGERFGHLFYKAPFKAYRFRMEYRFLSDHPADTPAWAIANSGVMIFAQDPKTMAVGDSFPVSVEAQLLGPAPGQTRFNGNMCSPGTHVVMDGQLVTTHCINSKTPSGPNDVWTAVRDRGDAGRHRDPEDQWRGDDRLFAGPARSERATWRTRSRWSRRRAAR